MLRARGRIATRSLRHACERPPCITPGTAEELAGPREDDGWFNAIATTNAGFFPNRILRISFPVKPLEVRKNAASKLPAGLTILSLPNKLLFCIYGLGLLPEKVIIHPRISPTHVTFDLLLDAYRTENILTVVIGRGRVNDTEADAEHC